MSKTEIKRERRQAKYREEQKRAAMSSPAFVPDPPATPNTPGTFSNVLIDNGPTRDVIMRTIKEAYERTERAMTMSSKNMYGIDIREIYGKVDRAPRSREEEIYERIRSGDPREVVQRIAQMEDQLKQQGDFIQGLSESACMLGLVSAVTTSHLVVRLGPLTVQAKRPTVSGRPDAIDVGDWVRVVQPSNQVLGRCEAPRTGPVGSVTNIDETDGTLEVEVNGSKRAVVRSEMCKAAKLGDAVVISDDGAFALDMAAQPSADMTHDDSTGVTWESIGGLSDAKEALREAIEYPIQHAALWAAYGRKPAKGALLWGPPGCGKTMLGKAVASSLQAHGAPGGFFYVKGPELLTKWVGATEEKIRSLFDRARRYRAEHGRPAVIFIDEAEALLGERRGRSLSGIEGTTVPTFLAEMDGLEEHAAFVLLSTNLPDALDPAVVRDGRIDRRIEVRRPEAPQALEILRLASHGVPCAEEFDAAEVIGHMFADHTVVRPIGRVEGGPELQLRMRDVVSGAVIAGVVGRAIDHAMRRDREAGTSEPSGVGQLDFTRAVAESCKELAATPYYLECMAVVREHLGHAKAQEWAERGGTRSNTIN